MNIEKEVYMTNIKEASSYESVTEEYAPKKPSDVTEGDVVEMMEKEWPEMTQEFKRIQHKQYEHQALHVA